MPRVAAERLHRIGAALLVAAGTPREEAEFVMRQSIDANLAGHDSHGIIQIPTYVERIQVGHIVPGAPWTIVQESPTTTVIDGHWGFGYTVTERAMQLTIDKAARSNVAATTVFRQGHIGRLASYTLMAAHADMIGLITADSGRASAPIRCRSPSRPTWTARCSWTWRRRRSRPARSSWPSRAASRCRW